MLSFYKAVTLIDFPPSVQTIFLRSKYLPGILVANGNMGPMSFVSGACLCVELTMTTCGYRMR